MLLPKTILKLLNKYCRNYLWNVQEGQKRMFMKSWQACCCPWDEGGFNIKEILSWNKALLCKWIWRLSENVSSIWSRWNACYTLKNGSIWTVEIKAHHFECWRGILTVKNLLVQQAGDIEGATKLLRSCVTQGKFQVSRMYDILRPKFPTVRWANTVWHVNMVPKHSFIFSLALQQKLATVDVISSRGILLVNWCCLCKQGAATYAVWLERNHRIFTGIEKDWRVLLNQIKYVVSVRILHHYRNIEDEGYFIGEQRLYEEENTRIA
ncbi:uncharacterized protein LOC141617743 [Silene latifolia]|uniref:uncharacterized protein LOC141617743 n=1 Tax=Silene latifolia TaxID=37657 RepID=UPI003D76BB5D